MSIKKFRPIKYILLFTAFCSLGGFASDASSLDMVDLLPIYEGALDVDKRIIDKESYQQLFFRLKKPYPSIDALNYYNQYFLDNGWIKCRGNTNKWFSYLDVSEKPVLLIHQIIHYWVKKPENKFSTVALRYYSEKTRESPVPDNNYQHVYIVMRKDIENLEAELSLLSVKCNFNNQK